jgi:hypothetical protein
MTEGCMTEVCTSIDHSPKIVADSVGSVVRSLAERLAQIDYPPRARSEPFFDLIRAELAVPPSWPWGRSFVIGQGTGK